MNANGANGANGPTWVPRWMRSQLLHLSLLVVIIVLLIAGNTYLAWWLGRTVDEGLSGVESRLTAKIQARVLEETQPLVRAGAERQRQIEKLEKRVADKQQPRISVEIVSPTPVPSPTEQRGGVLELFRGKGR